MVKPPSAEDRDILARFLIHADPQQGEQWWQELDEHVRETYGREWRRVQAPGTEPTVEQVEVVEQLPW